ncbi:NAD-dependent epimerase/dehydratase family protein [Novosphingobium sp.]|uniref:NAD-dependent epimerase/dehydratase family protein n=1 Tax=Novosphingobium sp. TaxID=1874826 RepID=UPI002600C445|nr:NAD-dependent epimerase/dehydratase family protein [Novosphingobium sp.]MCC6927063.1 NAD-dependent epimerase/dehydratase family protein [Novosphingobium sp.]
MAQRILVSGASGFIASHTVAKLLRAGYSVRGTVRDPQKSAAVDFLRTLPGAERLELVAADLSDENAFHAHAADVDFVLHMASPYVLDVENPQRDLVDPAVNGTLAMLEAAAASTQVRRVVVTSSMAAITDEPDGRILTEADWNTKSSLSRNPYYFSKVEAERAAWTFMERRNPDFDLISINPFMVAGPALNSSINTTNQLFVDLAKGSYPALMALEWGFVDVRDVALAHIRAMEAPAASGRYICAAENMNMSELVRTLAAAGIGGKLPKIDLSGQFGTAVMRFAARFQPPGVGSYLRTHLGRVPRFDNAKIRRDLGVAFRPVAKTISETARNLISLGHVPAAKLK